MLSLAQTRPMEKKAFSKEATNTNCLEFEFVFFFSCFRGEGITVCQKTDGVIYLVNQGLCFVFGIGKQSTETPGCLKTKRKISGNTRR